MGNNLQRVVVVTGGSGDIGRSICQKFASLDNIVYFSYYSDLTSAKKTKKLIMDAGFETIYKKLDVSCNEEVVDFFKFVKKNSGRIDVLINNAGINKDALLVRVKEQDWDNIISINLKGTFNCMKAASRTMVKQRHGRIINISSIAGISGNAGQASYAASKAGIIGLTKTVARELGSRNITVNAVAPGYIHTSMTKKINKNNIVKLIPLGRIGNLEDVSNAVYFLASEEASYITGQVVNVGGGIYM